MAELLDVYLRWPNMELATQLVSNSLLERDLGPNDVIIGLVESYLNEDPAAAEHGAIIKAFEQIEVVDRPKWRDQIASWVERFGGGARSDQPKTGEN